jgi:DNA-directed RNA polymerase subunit RPC12/RpoP
MKCSICNKEIKDYLYVALVLTGEVRCTNCHQKELNKTPKIEYGYLRAKAKNKGE